jgi:hypothetical protein
MWSEGAIKSPATGKSYRYWVKRFEEGSGFGIDGGKVSKLTIREVGEAKDLVNYDRGWDVEPDGDAKAVYDIILAKYN